MSPALRFSVLIFITITMMLANLFNMYAVIPYLDKIEHLLSGAWEIYEFVVDHLFGLHSQNASLTDTMLDIICGTVGAVVSSIYLLYKARVVTNNPVA
ncbi:hypothetical protein [Paenibacillus anaericanus]|uniref:hypothetical protein n=1 Tax=Paenibacillus anaericanus TaxID=170367 RepID=UPI0027D84D1D|nr:hypothetical protein [Paenibacillus anaericanus]